MFAIDGTNYVIDPTYLGNVAKFVNHSCDPNAEVIIKEDHIYIYSCKDISCGEEITIDYQFKREKDKILCSCGSSKCRGSIN